MACSIPDVDVIHWELATLLTGASETTTSGLREDKSQGCALMRLANGIRGAGKARKLGKAVPTNLRSGLLCMHDASFFAAIGWLSEK